MKNIQVIDSAENCVFDIFAATNAEFRLLFPHGHDVAFADEVFRRNRGKNAVLQNGNMHLTNQRHWADFAHEQRAFANARRFDASADHGPIWHGRNGAGLFGVNPVA